MKYKNVICGEFISRPNRFIATVNIDGEEQTVHVKNTGRCKELLVKGAKVYLSVSDNPLRRTKFDLIAVEKNTSNGIILINMDSQIPNDVVKEWLQKGNIVSPNAILRREVYYNKSRVDFYIEDGDRRIFLEVKGVTLENNGIASFPDAPTQRGIKHINELISAKSEGYEAYVLFVIQMKGVKNFTPNINLHPEFCEALKNARDSGVVIIAVDCCVLPDEINIDDYVDVKI